jgi:hypothetical protein
MKTTYAVPIAAIAFLAGFFCSQWTVVRYSEETERYLEVRSPEDRSDMAWRALTHLHGNSPNTVEFLESELDDAVIDLGDILAHRPVSQWTQNEITALKNVRDYRAKFPRTSGKPEHDRLINNALSLIDGKR